MIFRPVTPASPCGPPTTKRPVGFTKIFVFSSRSSSGITRLTIFSTMSSFIVSCVTSGLCWLETTTASTRIGLVPSYSMVAWDLPSGRGYSRTPARREHDRHRHQLLGLRACEAEHQSLIAGAPRVDAHRDVR